MEKKYIVTENPEQEQWKLLLRYGYPSNIEKYLFKMDHTSDDELIDFIAGSIMQSHAYFESAKHSSLYITPLLIYYGVTNLLVGFASLKTGKKIDIRGHGMSLSPPKDLTEGIGNSLITIKDSEFGGFTKFCEVFSDDDFPKGMSWKLKEVFSIIPDLRNDFEMCYSTNSNVIPIEVIKLRDRTIERINFGEYPFLKNNTSLIDRVKDLNVNYLIPEFQNDMVILNRKIKFKDIGVYSLHGRKFLQLALKKQGKLVNLSLLIAMYSGLYGLGFLSRYNPSIWNPFIQKDITGEKLLVEKFLSVSVRHLPNLVLNFIEDKDIFFVNETEGITDLRFTTLSEDINKIVQEQLEHLLYGKGMKYK
ncbi:YaaC family protein [Sporosarcina sp. SAFN-015]|uniref:YaaC family protein n=1 Tax=Sporosarcina sp. SAFN-015 TaxID=3387274 RepID=UPI003F7F17A7